MKKAVSLLLTILFIVTQFFAQSVPTPDHVVVLMMENYGYADIIGSPNAPHLNAVLNDSHAALFTQSYALYHPSQPNYIMLYSGNNQGVTNDNAVSNTPLHSCNLGASLIANNHTFKGYSEDLPSVGSLINSSGDYVRRHCPWTNWIASSGTNTLPASVHEPFSNFPTNTNYSSLPTVSFVIPNLADDMHNPTFPTLNYKATAISNGDTWFYDHLTDYINWAKTHNSLLIIDFDEDDGYMLGGVSTSSNQITTIFIGEMVQGGSYSNHINHYNTLRTLEDMYGLSYCDSSATSTPITNCWIQPITGLGEKSQATEITIFPNPASNSFELEFISTTHNSITISIFNHLSQKVADFKKEQIIGKNQIQIPVNGYKKGVYFIQVESPEGTTFKRLVID